MSWKPETLPGSNVAKMEKTYLRIDIEPKRLLITSEPYVIYTARGYQPVVDVVELRSKREYYVFISAKSISQKLEALRHENAGKLAGLEIWIRKESSEKMAGYLVEE
jgi:hypothetical protein